jgi:hypothetical protein
MAWRQEILGPDRVMVYDVKIPKLYTDVNLL